MTLPSMTSSLPLAAVGVPAVMLLACLSRPVRRAMPGLLWLAPLPALAAALLGGGHPPLAFDWPPYRLALALDGPGALLLGTSALLWIAAGVFAAEFFRGTPHRERFAVCWLLTLTGSLGIFVAADLALFLLFYALVSLPAYGMIMHDGSAPAARGGACYLGFALLGEGVLLLGFVLLAAGSPEGSLEIAELVAVLADSPSRGVILLLLVVGFGMKMALVPLHFWMPLTYAAAPLPAAAVLSGAGVKAGVIGMVRFLPLGAALPDWGHGLAAVGLAGAFFGVAVGITQSDPKAVLAYSSVSQMGFLAALLGMGLAGDDGGVAAIVAFYAAHHVLVKGGLFLGIGVARAEGRPRARFLVLWPAAVIALGLAGLPLTGGSLAKLAAKDPLGDGLAGALASWSAAGSTLLMLHFLHRLAATANPASGGKAPSRLLVPWLGLVVAAVAVPWMVFPRIGIGPLADVLAPAALWKVSWPLLAGGALALVLRRAWGRLPRIPNGDIAALGGGVARAAADVASACGRTDAWVRRWPVAGILLVVTAAALTAALVAGR